MGIGPGDRICFDTSITYTKGFAFTNIVGSAANPVVLTQCGPGVARLTMDSKQHALTFGGSSFFKISGFTGVAGVYGLAISQCSFGIFLGSGSTNIEIEFVEIFSNFGHAAVSSKTDPVNPLNAAECFPQFMRPNFVMKGLRYHDNFLHDVEHECFYIGYFAFESVVTCAAGSGSAHEIWDLQVYNNKLVRCGWEALQISSAMQTTLVFNNYIEDSGFANVASQNNGIHLQAGFKGDAFGNTIVSTTDGDGVSLLYQGSFGSKIYNNVVWSRNRTPFSASVSSSRFNPGSTFAVLHNTFIGNGPRGLNTFFKDPGPIPTQDIRNNVITWTGNPTVTWECLVVSPAAAQNSKNVCFRNGVDPLWNLANPSGFDFHVLAGSSLVGAGVAAGVAKDRDGVTRPAPPSIGAYELAVAATTAVPTTTRATTTAVPATTTRATTTAVAATTTRPATTAAATTTAVAATTAQATTAQVTTVQQATTAQASTAQGTTAQATTGQATTAQATTARATTVQGTTVQASTARASTTPPATTTRPATTGAAGGTTTSATGSTAPPCVPTPVTDNPAVPCPLSCCPGGPGMSRLEWKLTTDYAAFDCPKLLSQLSAAVGGATLRVCTFRRGSSFAEVEGQTATTTSLLDQLENKTLVVPQTEFARDMTSGRAVILSPEASIAVIVACIIAGIILIVLIILLIVWCRRRQQHKRSDSAYVAMPLATTSSSAAANYTAIPAFVPPQPAPRRVMRLVCVYAVLDMGEGILNLQPGMNATCEPQDWETASEWVWVTSGSRSGYVPREFCRVV